MNDSKKTQSNNFCTICGRPTNNKKHFTNTVRDNLFFICYTCQKVWCFECYSTIIGLSAKKTYSLGKNKKLECLTCKDRIFMNRLPKDLPFKQIRQTVISNQSQQKNEALNINITNINKKKAYLSFSVFISYAMADSKRLKISEIANLLITMKNIDRVHFWEGWNGFPNGNIIEFMEKGVTDCDVFIPVFTEASIKSDNCQKERDMAIFENKRIIPLFESFNLVPLACKPYLGVNLTGKNVNEIILELYNLINSPLGTTLKKFESKKIEKDTKKNNLENKQIKTKTETKNYIIPTVKNLEEELRDPEVPLEQLKEIARVFNFTGFSYLNKSDLIEFLLEQIKSPKFENNNSEELNTDSMKILIKLILDNGNCISENDLKDKYKFSDGTFKKNLYTLIDLFILFGTTRNDNFFVSIHDEFLKWAKKFVEI